MAMKKKLNKVYRVHKFRKNLMFFFQAYESEIYVQ